MFYRGYTLTGFGAHLDILQYPTDSTDDEHHVWTTGIFVID